MSGFSSNLQRRRSGLRGLGQSGGFEQDDSLISNLDSTVSQVEQSLLNFVGQQIDTATSYKDQLQQYKATFEQLESDGRLSSSVRSSISSFISTLQNEIGRTDQYVDANTDSAGNPVTGYEGLNGPRRGLGTGLGQNSFERDEELLAEADELLSQIQNSLNQNGSNGNGGNGSNGDAPNGSQTPQQAGFDFDMSGMTPVLLLGGAAFLVGTLMSRN